MHSPMGAHGPMGMHAGDQMGFGRGGYGMGVPLIPAPVAFMTMLFGLMIGLMIGRRKAMMHDMGMGGMGMGGMGHMGMGMGHGGMGHGMGMGGCGGGWSDWAMKKKMMMGGGGMPMHHHHGDGMPACGCGSADVSRADEGSSEE
jgi:hypothetical protein